MAQDVPVQWRIPMVEPAALEPGDPRAIGPFRIRGRLGSGGMGAVYLGQGRRRRQVAIKLIRGDQLHDDEFRARFRREVRAAAGVRSRFFANLVDADPEAAVPWLATEYVPGPTLSRALAEQGPLPREAVLTVVAGVAEALREIHTVGLVHRDVKPSNVILGPSGPCLIDLGVVALDDATKVTLTGQTVGTPRYMAPEQASGERTTASADVWGLGALAYYAATGNHLFEGEHPAVVLYRVSAEHPSYDDCPEYLRPLLDACLTRDPAQRPSVEAILGVSGLREWADAAASGREVPPAPVGVGASTGSAGSLPSWGGSARRAPGRRRTAWARAVAGTGIVLGTVLALGLLATNDVAPWFDEPDTTASLIDTSASASAPGGSDDPASPAASPAASGRPAPEAAESGPRAQGGAGSLRRPWAPGTTRRIDDESCWHVSLDAVEGRLATLTLSCSMTGTGDYGHPYPPMWLNVYAVSADGTRAPATEENAGPRDTYWSQGPLESAAERTVTVTLPAVGSLDAVEIRHDDGYGGHWGVTG